MRKQSIDYHKRIRTARQLAAQRRGITLGVLAALYLLCRCVLVPLGYLLAAKAGASAQTRYINETNHLVFLQSKPLVAAIVFLVLCVILWTIFLVLLTHRLISQGRPQARHRLSLLHLLDTFLYGFTDSVRLCLLPGIVSVALILLTRMLFRDSPVLETCTSLIYREMFAETFASLMVGLTAISAITYHLAACGLRPEAERLPGDRIRRRRQGAGLALTLIFPALFSISCLFLSATPDRVEQFAGSGNIIAHRGYSAQAPENTLDSFHAALDTGQASMIELDVRSTEDGVPVVIHNENLWAATGINASVYDMTYAQIRELTAPYRFGGDHFQDTYIPTLEEVLKTFGKRIPILIEIKMDDRSPNLPAQVASLIARYDCTATCMVQAGSYEVLEAVKAADPDITCGLVILYGAESYCDLPCADFFTAQYKRVREDIIFRVHAAGKKIYIWTLNREADMRSVKHLSVDGIITNYVSAAYEVFHPQT